MATLLQNGVEADISQTQENLCPPSKSNNCSIKSLFFFSKKNKKPTKKHNEIIPLTEQNQINSPDASTSQTGKEIQETFATKDNHIPIPEKAAKKLLGFGWLKLQKSRKQSQQEKNMEILLEMQNCFTQQLEKKTKELEEYGTRLFMVQVQLKKIEKKQSNISFDGEQIVAKANRLNQDTALQRQDAALKNECLKNEVEHLCKRTEQLEISVDNQQVCFCHRCLAETNNICFCAIILSYPSFRVV